MTALLAPLLAAAALRGSLDPTLVSEARVVGSGDAAATSVEMELNPGVLARIAGRRVEVSFGYSPRLTLRGLGVEPAFDVLHAAHIDASLRASRRLRITLFGGASIGTQTFSSVRLGESEGESAVAPPIQSLPSEAALPFLSFRAGAATTYVLTRRATLDALVDYGESGGLTTAARATIPLQMGPRAEVGAAIALSSKDRLRSLAEGSWITFSDGREVALSSLREAWTHRFTRRTESTLAAGLGFGLTRGSADESWPLALYPIAEASLLHRVPPKRLDVGLAVRLSPVVDWLTGELDARVAEDATLTLRLSPRASLWGRAGAAQSIPVGANGSLAIVLGEAGVRARLVESVELTGGTRGALQTQTETGSRQTQWTVFVGATITAPSVRF